MIQQYQEKLQNDIANIRVSASSGGGMVNVEMDGNRKILSLKIDPEVIKAQDVEMLQDLIIAAINEAIRKVDEESAAVMQSMLGKFNIPGLF
jgi:DNA-binding YbaB/EbfC family protein